MENIFEKIAKPTITHFRIEDAEDLLKRGLKHFIGDDYQWLPEYNEIVEWLSDNKGKGLLCMGNCGRGKTVICLNILSAVFQYLLSQNYNIYDSVEMGDKIEDIKSFGCNIMIDDIGLEQEFSKYGEKHIAFSEIVDIAEKKGLLLVITTNLNQKQLKSKYGERTFDRLKSLTKCVVFKGNSLRG